MFILTNLTTLNDTKYFHPLELYYSQKWKFENSFDMELSNPVIQFISSYYDYRDFC